MCTYTAGWEQEAQLCEWRGRPEQAVGVTKLIFSCQIPDAAQHPPDMLAVGVV